MGSRVVKGLSLEWNDSLWEARKIEPAIRWTVRYSCLDWSSVLQVAATRRTQQRTPGVPCLESEKWLSDETLVVPLEENEINKNLLFVEEPVELIDREVKR